MRGPPSKWWLSHSNYWAHRPMTKSFGVRRIGTGILGITHWILQIKRPIYNHVEVAYIPLYVHSVIHGQFCPSCSTRRDLGNRRVQISNLPFFGFSHIFERLQRFSHPRLQLLYCQNGMLCFFFMRNMRGLK